MIGQGDTALEQAVMADRRHPVEQIEVDWNLNGLYDHEFSNISDYVVDWEVNREITTNLPEGTTLVEGYVISSVTLTLAGRVKGLGIVQLLNQYYEAGPLYRKPIVAAPNVRVFTGYKTTDGTKWIQQFEGPVRIHELDSEDRTVNTEGLDPSDRLRTPVTLPQWMNYQDPFLDYDHYITTKTQFVIDFALRRQRVWASDPLRGDEAISCTFHGGMAAEVGTAKNFGGENPRSETNWFEDPNHPHGMLASPFMPGAKISALTVYSNRLWGWDPGQNVTVAHWVYIPRDDEWQAGGGNWQYWRMMSSGRSEDDYIYIGFNAKNADTEMVFGVNMVEGRSRLAIPMLEEWKGTWKWIAVQWHIATQTTYDLVIRVGGIQTYASTGVALPASVAPITARRYTECYFGFTAPMSNFRMWLDVAKIQAVNRILAEFFEGFVSSQVERIDPGVNDLLYLPNKVNMDCFELIKEAVEAEYGTVGYNQVGLFYFHQRQQRTMSTNEAVREITAHKSLKKLAFRTSGDTIRNIVTTVTRPRWAEWTMIYEAKTVRQFAFGTGETRFPVELEWGTWSYGVVDRLNHQRGTNWDETDNGFQAVYSLDTSIEHPKDSVEVYFRTLTDRTGEIVIYNYWDQPGMLATPDAQSPNPALKLFGYKLNEGADVLNTYASPGSRALYDDRVLPLEGNEWRQLERPMGEVATTLKNELKNSYPLLDDIPIVGDHRLQEGDIVMVADPLGLLPPIRCRIVKINRKGSKENGYEDVLTCRPISPPGLGIFNDPKQGILGETLMLGP